MAHELEFTVLDEAALAEALKSLPGWERDGQAIRKQYEFPTFMDGIRFVQRVAEAAESYNHHPDIIINYKKVTVRFWTHKKNAVTRADTVVAAEVDRKA